MPILLPAVYRCVKSDERACVAQQEPRSQIPPYIDGCGGCLVCSSQSIEADSTRSCAEFVPEGGALLGRPNQPDAARAKRRILVSSDPPRSAFVLNRNPKLRARAPRCNDVGRLVAMPKQLRQGKDDSEFSSSGKACEVSYLAVARRSMSGNQAISCV